MEERGNVAGNVSGFRVSSKSWFLTYPKCPMSKEEVLEALQKKKVLKAAVIAREVHEDGQFHIHAYVLLARRFDCRQSSFWDLGGYHGNYQKARCIDSVVKYIKKDGDLLEFGEVSWAEKIDSRQERRRYLGQKIISGVPLKQVVEEDPSLIFGLKTLSQDVCTWKQLSLSILDREDVRGIWIYGKPGVGKSYYVRTKEKSSLYLKAQNKWWDNYQGEAAVLIDDFDKQGVCLSHYLKIWADKYGCTGEIKGGYTPLCHDRLYITSNYSIDQLFPPDQDLESVYA